MPELPEVENFRSILLPLVVGRAAATAKEGVDKRSRVVLECPPPLPTKRFPSEDVINLINKGGYVIRDVLRKGKVLCIILEKQNAICSAEKKKGGKGAKSEAKDSSEDDETTPITGQEKVLYLSLHMGMTGRMSSPDHVPRLESLSENDSYPPPHTHLILTSNGEQAAFSDPRRFGSVLVELGVEDLEMACDIKDLIPTFRDIATDGLEASKAYCAKQSESRLMCSNESDEPNIVENLANRKKGTKGLLLDQRAVVSGVGNWVADEVLYRSHLHPDQSYLTITEAQKLIEELYHILSTAISCMNNGWDFPNEWLFHRRWRNDGGGGGSAKDFNGKTIIFIQSGGRSTAVVPLLQKIMGRKSLSQGKRKKAEGRQKKATGAASKKSNGSSASKQKGLPKKKSIAAKKAQPKKKVAKSTLNTSKTQGAERKHAGDGQLNSDGRPVRRSRRLSSY